MSSPRPASRSDRPSRRPLGKDRDLAAGPMRLPAKIVMDDGCHQPDATGVLLGALLRAERATPTAPRATRKTPPEGVAPKLSKPRAFNRRRLSHRPPPRSIVPPPGSVGQAFGAQNGESGQEAHGERRHVAASSRGGGSAAFRLLCRRKPDRAALRSVALASPATTESRCRCPRDRRSVRPAAGRRM